MRLLSALCARPAGRRRPPRPRRQDLGHQRPEDRQARGQAGRQGHAAAQRAPSSSSTARTSTTGRRRDGKTPAAWKLVDGGAMQVTAAATSSPRRSSTAHSSCTSSSACRTCRRQAARAAATAASTSRAATRCRCSTATAWRARTTTAARIYRWPRRWSTPARRRPSGRATTSSSPRRSARTARRPTPARMTVYHNGVKIHDNVLARSPSDNTTTAGMGGDPCTARPDHAAGPRQPGAVPQHLAGAGQVSGTFSGDLGAARMTSRSARAAAKTCHFPMQNRCLSPRMKICRPPTAGEE